MVGLNVAHSRHVFGGRRRNDWLLELLSLSIEGLRVGIRRPVEVWTLLVLIVEAGDANRRYFLLVHSLRLMVLLIVRLRMALHFIFHH